MSTRIEPSSLLRRASEIASFYGFRHAQSLDRELPREHRLSINGSRDADRVAQACVTCLLDRGVKAAKQAVAEGKAPEKPGEKREAILCFHSNPSPIDLPQSLSHIPAREIGEFGVSVVGSQGFIGEIMAMRTMFSILAEAGARVRGVRIGSAGDRDSQMRFARELGLYLKKRHTDLSECCKDASSDPLTLLHCSSEACAKVAQEGPRSMAYLSEKSRSHFREVLEYLDRAGMPYELDERMVYDEKLPRVLFSFDIENEDHLIVGVRGGRYDDHLRRISGKKDASVVRASMYFRKKNLERSAFAYTEKEKRAKIYFVKLGLEAALKSLSVLDTLRRAHIPVYQSFAADKLAPQLSEAERLRVPYLIIMGQREAMQDAVIVRRVETRSQQIVRLSDLPRYLQAV